MKDTDVDRVNAFAEAAIRDEVNGAMEANGTVRTLLTSVERGNLDGKAAEALVRQPYEIFRTAHKDVVDAIRNFLRAG